LAVNVLADRYDFGEFQLDARERRLSRGDQIVRLEPRSVDLLHFLLERAGKLVRKEELISAVWAQSVVTDNALTRCMHQVRAALDDDAEAPRYIETVPGAGYRFIAPVREAAAQESTSTNAPASRRGVARAVAVVIVASMAITGLLWIGSESTVSRPVVERLAVLPLTNLTGDEDQLYLVQGLHDLLITELSRTDDIDVISRTSVMRYQDTDIPVPEIARQLDVDALVEGSVMRSGDELSVTAQLVVTAPERHLWSERYEAEANEVINVAEEVANSIASEIGVTLNPVEETWRAARWSVKPEAYQAFLRGRFNFERKTTESYRQAQQLFRQAIDIDPDFAPAYVELGHTLASTAVFGLRKPADSMPAAKELAEQALRLDPQLLDAHKMLAGISFYWDWDWSQAEQGARHVLEVDPNAAATYRLLAEIFSVTGRHELAVDAVERSRELDPMLPSAQLKPVVIYYLNRDYDAAITNARYVVELYPQLWQGHWLLCLSLTAVARHEEANAACESAVSASRRTPMALGGMGYAYAKAGMADEAERILDELEAMQGKRYVGSIYLAMIHGALGNIDKALEELEEAYVDREIFMIHIENLGFFDSLRTDERFQALQSKVSPPRSSERNYESAATSTRRPF
jgi:DNA-binding winged helix-turn-helix (wHTH) protein/TolB-like protein/predicted Zn-dependent protease